jgi:recombination endonuclease VII
VFNFIPNRKFGKLFPIIPVGSTSTGIMRWLFACDCGRTKVIRSDKVLSGTRKSCGCGKAGRPAIWTTKRQLRLHNLTDARYDEFLVNQNYACAVCHIEFTNTPGIDHNHACCLGKHSCGKCVRGLLCGRCNAALGLLQDNLDSLRNALIYLEEHAVK